MNVTKSSLGIACCFLAALTIVNGSSSVPSAFQAAVGSWDVKLSSHRRNNAWSRLFPIPTRHHRKRNLDCRLSLYPNGTFVLRPQEKSESATTLTRSEAMPMRGGWRVKQNPYCITDRFYDELVLVSYPRVLLQRTENEKVNSEEILERAQVRFKCRMWGRYGSGICIFRNRKRKNTLRGGFVQWKSVDRDEPDRAKSVMYATFSGRQRDRFDGDEIDQDFNDEQRLYYDTRLYEATSDGT